METTKDINRWWLNPTRRPLGPVACRSLRWHKAPAPCLSKPVRNRRRFSNLDRRLRWPTYCVTSSRVSRNGKASAAWLEDRLRCLEGSGDTLSGQTPCTGIGRNRKMFLSDGCHDIVERIGRIVFGEESLTVVRRRSVRHALANSFNKSMKVYWPKSKGKLKSIPILFSHNLLYLFVLQQFSKNLSRLRRGLFDLSGG